MSRVFRRFLRTATARSEEHTSELQSHLNLVCRLLLEKHSKGIIHRDLKPENFMARGFPEAPENVKMLDFGIAHLQNVFFFKESGNPRDLLSSPTRRSSD